MGEEEPNLLAYLVDELAYLIDEKDEDGLHQFFTKCMLGYRLSKALMVRFSEEMFELKEKESPEGVELAKKVLSRF